MLIKGKDIKSHQLGETRRFVNNLARFWFLSSLIFYLILKIINDQYPYFLQLFSPMAILPIIIACGILWVLSS